ncbi:ATP-binding protein [Nonomuraea dietziae]|uniref:ATP-binding protein n=1 Tax=Nonomuraea dietziae TaxID=65515 RepID=UPI00342AC8C9
MERGNLPADVTGFVGRRAELKEVRRLLGRARLVTLTGVAGVGKTRLAMRAAHSARRAFDDGVFFVDLSTLHDPGLIETAIADAMRLTDQTARTDEEVLTAHLADKRLLLVLDGTEHLVGRCAQLVELLLSRSPGLKILVAGRQALEIEGEHLLPVPSLTLSDAVALLADRALAATGAFAVTAENEALVRKLCLRLDRIPLAIELAAVRLRALSVEEVVEGLDHRFKLLDLGSRAGGPRHQTLRAAIGWSHELCTPDERLLWARLSVFSGGFGLVAAESVCSGGRLPRAAIVDLVGALVDKSILIREEREEGVRYSLIDSVREYGAEWLGRLGAAEADALRARHTDFYLRLARANEADWFGPRQQAIFSSTRVELGNLRAAFERCLDAHEQALDMAATLWFYWVGCGQLREGRHWLGRALSAAPEPTSARMRALWVAGYVCVLIGESDSGTRFLEECRDHGDQRAVAYAVHRLGCAALIADEHDRAVPLFTEAVERYAKLGVLECNVLMACVELAIVLAFRGELDSCAELCDQVRDRCERVGEQWVLSYVDYVEAYAAWAKGARGRALSLALRSLRVSHRFHDLVGIVLSVELVALLRAEAGEPEVAAVLQGAAGTIWRSVGPLLFDSRHFNRPHLICAEQAERELGGRVYAAAYARGRRLGLDEAVSAAAGGREPRAELPLTRREWEVAQLVAEGLSNREMAEQLVLSKRTVDAHVEHILDKLGFSSRAQIAAWVTSLPS